MKIRTVLAGTALVAVVGVAAAVAVVYRPSIDPIASVERFPPALVAKGAQLAAVGDCAVCHAGPDGTPYVGGKPVQTPFGAVYATNITPDRETGIGTWSNAAFSRAMQDGVDRSGGFLYPAFPYNHYTHASGADIAAIYAFLMTREPVRSEPPATDLPFPFNIRPLMAGWNLLFLDHTKLAPDTSRGAYLVESLGHCSACHTPRNALGAEETSHAYTGGQADGWDAPGLTAASSPAAIAWTADALYQYLKHGVDDQHASPAGPMLAVSHNLAGVPDEDIRAMATYIASMTDPDGKANAPDREKLVAVRVAAAHAPPPGLQQMAGASIFAGACAACHGAGAPMMLNGRPSLALGSSVTAATPRNATQTILYGLQPRPQRTRPLDAGIRGNVDRQAARRRASLPAGALHRSPGVGRAREQRSAHPAGDKLMISLTVNGRTHEVDVDPATPLLYVLRDTLELHGAKYGCGVGQCGSCTVMLDNQAVISCLTPVSVLAGRQVRTVEGLGTAEHPGPLQQAFIDEQAAQCGYCIAGMIMRAQALLERTPSPTDAQIRAHMQPNLCRCGTHMRILAAIQRAAATMRQAA